MNNAYCKQTSIVNKYFADSGMLCYNTRLGCLTRDHQELLSSIRDVHYFLGQSFDRFPSYCFYPTKFYRDFEQSYGIVRKAVCIAPPVIVLFIHASRNDFRKIDNPHLYCFTTARLRNSWTTVYRRLTTSLLYLLKTSRSWNNCYWIPECHVTSWRAPSRICLLQGWTL